jgi:hypothetical protein
MPTYDIKKEIVVQLLDDHISDSVDEIYINWTQIYSERPDSEEEDGNDNEVP